MNCAYAVFQKIYFEASHRPGEAWKYPPTDANAATSRTHSQPTFKALISPFVVQESSARWSKSVQWPSTFSGVNYLTSNSLLKNCSFLRSHDHYRKVAKWWVYLSFITVIPKPPSHLPVSHPFIPESGSEILNITRENLIFGTCNQLMPISIIL